MHKITTTIRPDDEIEVSDAEFLDLQRQGLVKEDKTPAAKTAKQERNTQNA